MPVLISVFYESTYMQALSTKRRHFSRYCTIHSTKHRLHVCLRVTVQARGGHNTPLKIPGKAATRVRGRGHCLLRPAQPRGDKPDLYDLQSSLTLTSILSVVDRFKITNQPMAGLIINCTMFGAAALSLTFTILSRDQNFSRQTS